MKLRMLEQKDAPFMHEWMKNGDVVEHLHSNFKDKTIEDCKDFISYSQTSQTDLNLAIADESDEYLGTVSLKHIMKELGIAEFAITVRKKTMGTGASSWGMKSILEHGIHELGLKQIFWCVNKINVRAVRFYDKNGYKRIEKAPQVFLDLYPSDLKDHLLWYVYEEEQK